MPPVAKNPAFKSKSKATDTAPNKDLNEDDYFLTSVRVPNRSPARSEFGDEYRQEDVLAPFLPKHIQAYLRQNGLEAFLVPADGNCLYRALTFGPEWNRHRMARGATAGYLSGLKQDANILAMLLTDDQVEEIRQDGNWFNIDIGEQQIKGFAETFNVDVEVFDANNLLRGPVRYSGHPFGGGTNTEISRILLYREHYYPLFPVGSFPNRGPMSGRDALVAPKVRGDIAAAANLPSVETSSDKHAASHTKPGDNFKTHGSRLEVFQTDIDASSEVSRIEQTAEGKTPLKFKTNGGGIGEGFNALPVVVGLGVAGISVIAVGSFLLDHFWFKRLKKATNKTKNRTAEIRKSVEVDSNQN